jgi:hypothetical protein
MISYNGKDYKSKSEIIRNFFSIGKISNLPSSKNAIAKELKVSVPTVNQVITRFQEKMGMAKKIPPTTDKKVKKKPLSPFPTKQKQIIEEPVIENKRKVLPSPNFIVASEDGKKLKNVSKELIDEEPALYKHPIVIDFVPNPWGLPITTPPLRIIDQRYKSKKSACISKAYETPTIEY